MNQTSVVIIVCTWFSRLVWLNVCWAIGVLLGGGVLGIFPATTSVLILSRRYLNATHSISLRDYLRVWRAEFVSANKGTAPLLLLAMSLSWYLLNCVNSTSQALQLLGLAILPLIVFDCLLIAAVLIESSVYKGTVKEQWLRGLTLLRNRISLPLVMLICAVVCLICGLVMPILALLLLSSPACLLTMAWYLHCFPEHNQIS